MMKDAADVYHAMLEKCDAVTDDDGIPPGLYSAERLLTAGQDLATAGEYVIHRVNATHWRFPNEAYLLRSLLNAISSDNKKQASLKLYAEIHDMEQIMALANDGQDRSHPPQGLHFVRPRETYPGLDMATSRGLSLWSLPRHLRRRW